MIVNHGTGVNRSFFKHADQMHRHVFRIGQLIRRADPAVKGRDDLFAELFAQKFRRFGSHADQTYDPPLRLQMFYKLRRFFNNVQVKTAAQSPGRSENNHQMTLVFAIARNQARDFVTRRQAVRDVLSPQIRNRFPKRKTIRPKEAVKYPESSIACCDWRRREAATIFIADVILRVDLIEAIRFRSSLKFAMGVSLEN